MQLKLTNRDVWSLWMHLQNQEELFNKMQKEYGYNNRECCLKKLNAACKEFQGINWRDYKKGIHKNVRYPIDKGMIRALMNAGWSNGKILQEFQINQKADALRAIKNERRRRNNDRNQG